MQLYVANRLHARAVTELRYWCTRTPGAHTRIDPVGRCVAPQNQRRGCSRAPASGCVPCPSRPHAPHHATRALRALARCVWIIQCACQSCCTTAHLWRV